VARYGINPLQRLRLMLAQLGRPGAVPAVEWQFHAELIDVFNSLRDLHTRYRLSEPFTTAAAVLPFLLKEFTEEGRRRYLVGRRQADQGELGHPTFRFGVEVTHWNGVPIARAVDRFAERFPGANPEARHARAVERFTVRSLAFGPPPDEDWIVVDYLDLTNQPQKIRLTWDVRSLVPAAEVDSANLPVGIDVEGAQLARLRALLFAPEFIAAERSGEPVAQGGDEQILVTAGWSTFFEARKVATDGATFGHLRIRTFYTQDVVGFVREFIRLLGTLPQDGLVLDIRGNGGGAVAASELSLQALTARPFQPVQAQFAATPLNLRIARANDDMEPWRRSMEQAMETGTPQSAAIPFFPAELFEAVPQSYFGPIVLITDARCYSAADIFAAGFQDNGIGTILGVDGNTGAGGGQVWKTADLLGSLPSAEDFPFRPLPGGAELTVVIRRLLRVGPDTAGTPLEDYGVVPHAQHVTTRADIMDNDADLMAAAAAELAKLKRRRFDVELHTAGEEPTVTFHVLGIDRADVVVDGRPRLTVDLGGNPAPTVIPDTTTPNLIVVTGYDAGQPVALRRFIRAGDTLVPQTTLTL